MHHSPQNKTAQKAIIKEKLPGIEEENLLRESKPAATGLVVDAECNARIVQVTWTRVVSLGISVCTCRYVFLEPVHDRESTQAGIFSQRRTHRQQDLVLG